MLIALLTKAEESSNYSFQYHSLSYSSLRIDHETALNGLERLDMNMSSSIAISLGNSHLNYRIPKVKSIQTENRWSAHNTDTKINLASNKLSDVEICSRARSDAENFHGKKIGYLIGGIIFGPLAILNAAAIKHRPSQGELTRVMSENKDLFEDPTYKACYNRRAKWILVKKASVGTILWSVLGSALTVAFK